MKRQVIRDPYNFVGKTLGRYYLHEFVGIGGMGVVYRAQHITTEGIVAVKVLKPDLALQNSAMDKYFFEEAKKTVGLNHPYIIKVTDADMTADGTAFLVMEWLDGHTLEEEMRACGKMDLERVTILLEQICEAAAHAHSKGIIHRDLKPGNIMVVRDYKGDEAVKILDFGIAKALTSTMGTTSRVMGAPYYASPEQLVVSVSIDHRSDIYTLGVILHQLLTGEVPFDADSIEGMIYKHISVPPPAIRQIRPEIPEALEGVILRALAKRPDDRYQSAIEFARAFRQATSLETGSILIECLNTATGADLPGAAIYINGKFSGRTNEEGRWFRKDFSSGAYFVEVDSSQYLRWKKRIHIEPNEEVTVVAELAPRDVGDLIIKTAVAGTEVLLDGETIGTTDQSGMLYVPDLPPGQKLVEMRHPKYQPIALQVEIIQGQAWNCEVTLTPLPLRRPLRDSIQKIVSAIKLRRNVSARQCRQCGTAVQDGGKLCGNCQTQVDEANADQDGRVKRDSASVGRNFLVRRRLATVGASILVFAALAALGTFLYVKKRDRQPVVEIVPPPAPSVTPGIVVPTPAPTPAPSPPDMVYIAGGAFTMGRNSEEATTYYEEPAHKVTVEPFLIDIYEVTNEQYARFLEANLQPPPSTWKDGKYDPATARMPVTGINWNEAKAYAEWAGKRLPTEEEWEFAARGTDQRLYPWGKVWDPKIVNAGNQVRKFDEVGSRPANASPFGVYDMVGNAWEWTSSDLTIYPGSKQPSLPPGVYKVLRGGSWQSIKEHATATCRFGWRYQRVDNNGSRKVFCDPDKNFAPNDKGDCDYSNVGFRCAMSVPPPPGAP